jgi:hypothetical protein
MFELPLVVVSYICLAIVMSPETIPTDGENLSFSSPPKYLRDSEPEWNGTTGKAVISFRLIKNKWRLKIEG